MTLIILLEVFSRNSLRQGIYVRTKNGIILLIYAVFIFNIE